MKKTKKEALLINAENNPELTKEVLDLKNSGASFLRCVAFIQRKQQLSLAQARQLALTMKIWTESEKATIDTHHKLMLSEYTNDDN